jgi:hypothetical protein
MKGLLRVSMAVAILIVAVGLQLAAQGGARAGQRAASAQPAAQTTSRAWYSVNVITVKRETANEWRDFQRTQTIPMQQRGGVKQRDTWQGGAPFGDGATFAIVTPIEKFEDYDKPPLVDRMLSGDALRSYQQKNAQLVVSNHMFAIQDRAELSIPPASTAKVRGMILTDVTVVAGHTDQYEAYIKNDLLPVLKKGNVLGYGVSRTVFGGNANDYHTVQYFDSYGDIDKGPLTARVLGQAAAQALAAKATPHIASLSRTIYRYVPELSYARRPNS